MPGRSSPHRTRGGRPGTYPGATKTPGREGSAMSTTAPSAGTKLAPPAAGTIEFKLEVMVLPVSDVDRAKQFYAMLGWREAADFPIRDGFRVVQMTPPGSPTSVIFGDGVTGAVPGSYEGLVLAVYDVEAARDDLLARGVEVSEIWHGAAGSTATATRRASPAATPAAPRTPRGPRCAIPTATA